MKTKMTLTEKLIKGLKAEARSWRGPKRAAKLKRRAKYRSL